MTARRDVGAADWIIRFANGSDVDALLEIERASAGRWQREGFQSAVAGEALMRVWVAQEATRVVGFLVAWVLAPECEIHNIATSPDWRRRGVARSLLDHLEEVTREAGVQRLFLEVRSRNLGAQALYKQVGFVISGKRRGYYGDDGDDALVMERQL